jgi:triosephosphate isomerase (TIM)
MRTPFVVGNWKLHKTINEALTMVTELKNQIAAIKGVEVGVAPVFTALHAVAKRVEDSALAVVAQDCFWETKGAWTGEVAAVHIADAGATWAIVGHSERRQYFGDTSDSVGKKAVAALAAGLGAIVCIGETDAERDAGKTFDVVDSQLGPGLAGVDLGGKIAAQRVVIAYEPVWAIGTGRTATPAQAQEVHAHIRKCLRERFGGIADHVRIQYGGSVKPSNVESLMSQPDIDGALVGGASLEVADFVAIVKGARGSSARL